MQSLPTVRARASLEGLALGDAFGDRLFFDQLHQSFDPNRPPFAERALPGGRWDYTDDTQMALSITEVLTAHGQIDQDALAVSFGQRFERGRGYGPAMYDLLPQLRAGVEWRIAARSLFGGQGSFGNGGAMRIAPLGAWFADNLPQVVTQATLATEVTHAHPEAIAGAIAVAIAAAIAWQTREDPIIQGAAFLSAVLPWIPESVVRDRVEQVIALPGSTPIWCRLSLLCHCVLSQRLKRECATGQRIVRGAYQDMHTPLHQHEGTSSDWRFANHPSRC
jgi:ADP-ribosylglycohydrolase